MALTRLDAGLGGAERFLEELEKKRKVLDQCLQARGIVHALGLPTAHCALLLALLTSPSPSRRTQQPQTSLTMGLGRKANKEDTSATSTSGDESSCMPSEMAADLSNSALEVR